MSNFDLRTKEKKTEDEILLRIKRDLAILMDSYIPVDHYFQKVGEQFHRHAPEDGEYFFADYNLGFVYTFKHSDVGVRIRRSAQNVRYIDKIIFKIG